MGGDLSENCFGYRASVLFESRVYTIFDRKGLNDHNTTFELIFSMQQQAVILRG